MRTFHFFSPSDREHRLMFQTAAAPEAPLPAPATTPAEAPAVPIETPDAVADAAAGDVSAAGAAVTGAANAAVPDVGANSDDVPADAAKNLQKALSARGAEEANIRAQEIALSRQISRLIAHHGNRAEINRLKYARSQLRQPKPAPTEIVDARQTPPSAERGPAVQGGGAPPETGGDAPAPTPELALARAEQAMEDRRATTDERAAGSMQLIDATREQLIRMGESDLAVPNRDPAVRKRQEKLQSAILTNGGGIDAFKNELRTNYNNAKIDLDARRTDAMTEKAQAEGNLVRLRTELSAEQQENNPGSQADIVRLTTEIQQAEESVHELTDQIATLTNKSTTLRNEFNADMHALDDTGESTAEIAARCKGKIMSAAEILKESSSADNRQLGTLLDNITIGYIPDGIDLIPVQVTGAAVGQEEFIQTQLGNPRALQSAPRLLAALDATLKKAQATA